MLSCLGVWSCQCIWLEYRSDGVAECLGVWDCQCIWLEYRSAGVPADCRWRPPSQRAVGWRSVPVGPTPVTDPDSVDTEHVTQRAGADAPPVGAVGKIRQRRSELGFDGVLHSSRFGR